MLPEKFLPENKSRRVQWDTKIFPVPPTPTKIRSPLALQKHVNTGLRHLGLIPQVPVSHC